ncbi:putative HTH-type transcriptional regulator [Sulfitobacter sp. THAF37]|uniref:LysR family transcriptional regulator ArgP n=1 Tax=Sulfitobacter sp. THAF37 TaxID=2587855 RepID=UPI0012693389|nr:LysR family transcriptional regulator ArgP [Sulfitobacter sp. THAF37]QFT57273.1 putative HTH-type transcriptional regulator [Sulfitobacter sp. THAF37]
MPLDPHQLAALSAVLRLGSFDAAAAALRVTPSAVSQRIKALEENVGTTLVHRGQPCTGTETGARLARHAEDVALLEAQALAGVAGRNETAPRVSLAVPADSLATWLIPALAQVEGLLFDLVLDDQDTSDDWLRRGEVNAAVTGHARAAPGCDVHPLGSLRYVATASPDFMARYFGGGFSLDALAAAPLLVFNPKDRLQHRWAEARGARRFHPPVHHLPSSHGFADAALCGLGWGMNPLALVADHLARGALVPLVPDAPLDVPLFWQVTRVMAPALKPLTDAVRKNASWCLRPASGTPMSQKVHK